MNLEDDLYRALRRKPAPPDFAERVIARLDPRQRTVQPAWRGVASRWLAAAAAAAVVVTGALSYQAYRESVVEAERVAADVRLALQITGEKIALAQRKVEESARR